MPEPRGLSIQYDLPKNQVRQSCAAANNQPRGSQSGKVPLESARGTADDYLSPVPCCSRENNFHFSSHIVRPGLSFSCAYLLLSFFQFTCRLMSQEILREEKKNACTNILSVQCSRIYERISETEDKFEKSIKTLTKRLTLTR